MATRWCSVTPSARHCRRSGPSWACAHRSDAHAVIIVAPSSFLFLLHLLPPYRHVVVARLLLSSGASGRACHYSTCVILASAFCVSACRTRQSWLALCSCGPSVFVFPLTFLIFCWRFSFSAPPHVCLAALRGPQYDILWEDLTAKEHLELFCAFKSLTKSQIAKEVVDRLEVRRAPHAPLCLHSCLVYAHDVMMLDTTVLSLVSSVVCCCSFVLSLLSHTHAHGPRIPTRCLAPHLSFCLASLVSACVQDVNLSSEKDNVVRNFSGGMRRRLSVAIGES